VLVLDEPLAGLDAPGRRRLVALVDTVRAHGGTSVVSVTHDLAYASLLGDRAVVLDRGRVVADGAAATLVGGTAPRPETS
jgi:energy-coupling factor transporter ATP-binding protein EcfA2